MDERAHVALGESSVLLRMGSERAHYRLLQPSSHAPRLPALPYVHLRTQAAPACAKSLRDFCCAKLPGVRLWHLQCPDPALSSASPASDVATTVCLALAHEHWPRRKHNHGKGALAILADLQGLPSITSCRGHRS